MNEKLLVDVIDLLKQDAQSLRAAQTVQRSAYLLLARRLAQRQLIDRAVLADELRLMADVQADEDWRSGHLELAEELLLSCGLLT